MSIIIIGCGFAGAATAWWLTQFGVRDVVILEREDMPGVHSSGLNASMTRGFDEDGAISALAEEGGDFIRRPPDGFADGPLVEQNGSLIIASKKRIEAGIRPKDSKILTRAEAARIVPLLSNVKFDYALWSPSDGVVDIHAYLWAFINGAKAKGARLITNCEVKGFDVIASPSSTYARDEAIQLDACYCEPRSTGQSNPDQSTRLLRRPSTDSGLLAMTESIKADIIVNAAGGWAQEIARLAGAEELGIKPYRRHLYCTPPMNDVNPKWPFVWDIDRQYYFRPESGGLLLGPADEEEVPPRVPAANPKIREVLAEKLEKYCPPLAGLSIAREWCGLRTFAPDRRPVIRRDNKVKNFFWVAGLGGFGVNCAAAVGRLAAEKIMKMQVIASPEGARQSS